MLFHRCLEGRVINADPARPQRVLCEIERKTERVIELEGDVAREHGAFCKARGFFAEKFQTVFERFLEARFFKLQRFRDKRLPAHEFRERVAHFFDECWHKPVHQRLRAPHLMRVTHGAAHDPAQDITTPFVRRQHAISN